MPTQRTPCSQTPSCPDRRVGLLRRSWSSESDVSIRSSFRKPSQKIVGLTTITKTIIKVKVTMAASE
jgi:hypothetical protein